MKKMIIYIIVGVVVVLALGGGYFIYSSFSTVSVNSPADNISLDLKIIANLIGRQDITAEEVAKAIGDATDKGSDHWYIKSQDNRFQQITLYFETTPDGKKVPEFINFEIKNPSQLSVNDLVQIFGEYSVLPANPDSPFFNIDFDKYKPNRNDDNIEIRIFAEVSYSPSLTDSTVERLTIRRDVW